jgi:hypothetical protein
MDVVEAIGQAVAIKALDDSSPKQVDAARFLLQEGGISERSSGDESIQAVAQGLAAGVVHALVDRLARLVDEQG